MNIEKAKKILKGMFYNDNGEKMHYIDFSDSYGDEWGGYTLPEYIEAIETVLNELDENTEIINNLINEVTIKDAEIDKKDKVIEKKQKKALTTISQNDIIKAKNITKELM